MIRGRADERATARDGLCLGRERLAPRAERRQRVADRVQAVADRAYFTADRRVAVRGRDERAVLLARDASLALGRARRVGVELFRLRVEALEGAREEIGQVRVVHHVRRGHERGRRGRRGRRRRGRAHGMVAAGGGGGGGDEI